MRERAQAEAKSEIGVDLRVEDGGEAVHAAPPRGQRRWGVESEC